MPFLYFTLLQLTCVLVAFAVPSDINYQGRLSDANGNPVTGDVTMGVKLYDAQTGGSEIYSEDIGTVTLDENGVYSFQFGASGDSTVTKTETIITSDGTSTDYTGNFTSLPVDGSVSVSDGTYSWNEVDGNPGEQATAYIIIINGFVIYADLENGGSGYDDDNPPLVTITGDGSGATATATVENGVVTEIIIDIPGTQYTEGDIVIAPPPSPFVVNEVDGNLEVQYASAPSNTTVVEATYKTLEPSIIGALSEASSHWLELSVDGVAQNPRERILSVPFAQFSGVAQALDQNKSEFVEYRTATGGVSVAAGETIEVVQIFQSRTDYDGELQVSVSGLGKTARISRGLSLPFRVSGPTSVGVTGSGIENPSLIYRIFNSDGSIKLKSDVEENDALNELVIPVSVANQEAFNADHPVYFDNVWSDALEAGQSFTASNSMSIDSISFWISRLNHITGNFVLNLYNSIEPNTSIASKTFSVSEGEQSVTVVLNDPVELIEGDEYFFMIAPDTVLSEGNLYYAIGMGSNGEINDSTYEGGHQLFRSSNGSLMPTSNDRDLKFMISLSEAVTGSSDVYPEFSIIEGNFSWDQAFADAESRGGRLAVLDTQDKINDSLLILATADYPKVWIGLRDHNNDNVDTWINGSPVSANNYGEGQPDSFGEIHIRTIEPNSIYGDPGQWLDEDSWKSFSYLLETLPE
ncbi:MAG: lectin-like protein [Coraliomargaritaceae bacterium]